MHRALISIRRPVTLVAAALFVALGFWLMLDPAAIEGLYPISLNEPMALSEVRAVFGGLMLGVGASVLLLDIWLKRSRDAAMVLATITGGLVLARLFGFSFEGSPSGTVLNEVIFEFCLFAILVISGAYRCADD